MPRRPLTIRSFAAIAGLLLSSCFFDEVPLEGKSCPCSPGFECELETRSCVPMGTAVSDAGNVADAGPADTGAPIACTTDRDCGDSPSRVCVAGACQSGCAAGGPACEAPATCDTASGQCLVEGECMSSMDCAPPLSVCLAGRCAAGCTVSTGACELDGVCEPSTGECGPSPACTDGSECPLTHYCDGATCRARCSSPGAPPCRGSSSCNPDTGRCDGGLALGEDCRTDVECASGECLGVRRGLINYAFCGRTCGATSDCPLGFGCISVSGAGQCIPNRVLGSEPGARSLRSGRTCDIATNLCQSVFCESSTCVERCSRDRDCRAFGGSCVAATQMVNGERVILPRCLPPFVAGAPGDSCQRNIDCAGGLCDTALSTPACARLCCAERDCPNDQACVALQVDGATLRVCRPRGAGTGVLGAPCESDGDCATGVCGPADASNPGGPQICTTYCCTDPDCGELPGGGRCATSAGPFPDTSLGRCAR